ncbi:MAG: HEAT repeat domain-containing protein [Polyangiaceae bacterium]
MSYDISIYRAEFLELALAEGLGDWTNAPALPEDVRREAEEGLHELGFEEQPTGLGKELLLDTPLMLAEASIFEGSIHLSVPFSERAEHTISTLVEFAKSFAFSRALGYYDPQTGEAGSTEAQLAQPTAAEVLSATAEQWKSADSKQKVLLLEQLAYHSAGDEATARFVADALRTDSDHRVRFAAGEVLSSHADLAVSVTSELVAALSDKHPYVRGEAAFALGNSGTRSDDVLSALQALTADPEYGPRARANEALAKLK